jgi:hypothetical protein
MNLERIEQALRDGPPDEPTYAPGSFGRPRRAAWWIALAGLDSTSSAMRKRSTRPKGTVDGESH